jgi:hypothetical protein
MPRRLRRTARRRHTHILIYNVHGRVEGAEHDYKKQSRGRRGRKSSAAEEEGEGKAEQQRNDEGRIGARPEEGETKRGAHTCRMGRESRQD